MKQGLLMLAHVFLPLQMMAALGTYNFQSLAAGSLVGQDGWFYVKPSEVNNLTVTSSSDTNIMTHVQGSVTEACWACRKRDSSFFFSTPEGTETNFVYGFDFKATGLGAFFFPGMHYGPSYYGGPSFGYGYSGRFAIREAGFGTGYTSTQAVILNHWYRLRLRINFAANSGDGAGTLEAMDLTAGETQFAPLPGLQNINLRIGQIATNAPPPTWTAMFIRSDNRTPLDNLTLPMAPAPLELNIHVSQVQISWNSSASTTYQIEYRSEETTNRWIKLMDPIMGTGGVISVPDAIVPGRPKRFYRVETISGL